jgi:hypothetical protein
MDGHTWIPVPEPSLFCTNEYSACLHLITEASLTAAHTNVHTHVHTALFRAFTYVPSVVVQHVRFEVEFFCIM